MAINSMGKARSSLAIVTAVFLLAACGGGGNNGPVSVADSEPNAPRMTGDTATDAFTWFNFRRQQAGLPAVLRDPRVDTASLGHAKYMQANNTITHQQVAGKAGFTGERVGDRLVAAGYSLSEEAGYAFGEVLSQTSNDLGENAAEDLIRAIYHRFVIMDPAYRDVGTGAASNRSTTYLAAKFATNGLNGGLGPGRIAVYPFADQQRVATSFNSDEEEPDPAPNRNQVGYPISVHADVLNLVEVALFTVTPRGETAALPVRLLTNAADTYTPTSAAAIVPLDPLRPGTTYDVRFEGSVDGTAVTRTWSFTTKS